MKEEFDIKSHIGEIHGIYTIVEALDEKDKYNHRLYKCICNECGFEKKLVYGKVAAPSSVVTKCAHLRANGDYITNRHKWSNKRIGKIFRSLIGRCYNQNNEDYQWYGQKGINVCQEWLDNPKRFEEWSLNHGYTDDLTIDRINPDEDYYPNNCRWISLEENARRAGKVNWITLNDETLTGRQWAEKLGLSITSVNKYIDLYGEDKTKQFISAALKEPLLTKTRKANQSWFDVYGIQV